MRLEPCGLNGEDGKRTKGETLTSFENGLRLVWDATIGHPLARSNVPKSLRSHTASALAAEESKDNKYSFLSGKAIFAVAAVETLGAFDPSASFLIKRITRWQGHAGSGPSRYSRLNLEIASREQSSAPYLRETPPACWKLTNELRTSARLRLAESAPPEGRLRSTPRLRMWDRRWPARRPVTDTDRFAGLT